MGFCGFWRVLVQFWCVLVNSVGFWWVLVSYGAIVVCSGEGLAGSGELWCSFGVLW